jgi:acyl-CoA hydrolase/GNAT superfamily N-acetyltransferase
MSEQLVHPILEEFRALYPDKFVSIYKAFSNIHRGDSIFIGTACGEPQFLVNEFIDHVSNHPEALFDAEIIQVYTLGFAPYTDKKFKKNFRHNCFFIGENNREAVNNVTADYAPTFLSEVPRLISTGLVPIDVALIQTSIPDSSGFVSLGISVDIVKAASRKARIIIAQVNSEMPRVHGESFIHIKDIDFIVPYDEPLLEFESDPQDDTSRQIGEYVSRIVQDGDTIQVGYGSIPNAIMSHLQNKQHLGVHTELISDGIVELLKKGVIDNTQKTINKEKTIASFCMGKRETYRYINDNPAIEFKSIDNINNPLVIAKQDNFVAINTALEIDLTGQATAESIGGTFYSGIGGASDFIRGAALAKSGKSIIALPSTAKNGMVSRIVPFLQNRAGVTVNRGDVHYVVTEYGIAYLHGKNIRERAMRLIAIAHPSFRPGLIQEAKEYNLIYKDQAFIPGKKGEYPAELETYRTTSKGLEIFLRPLKISDEPLLKDIIHNLSDQSLYRRFISTRTSLPHEFLQDYVVVDYSKDMAIIALQREGEAIDEKAVGVCRYYLDNTAHMAEISFAVPDNYQSKGIATTLLSYLTTIARDKGLLGFTAEVLAVNHPMLHIFKQAGFEIDRTASEGNIYHLSKIFSR